MVIRVHSFKSIYSFNDIVFDDHQRTNNRKLRWLIYFYRIHFKGFILLFYFCISCNWWAFLIIFLYSCKQKFILFDCCSSWHNHIVIATLHCRQGSIPYQIFLTMISCFLSKLLCCAISDDKTIIESLCIYSLNNWQIFNKYVLIFY